MKKYLSLAFKITTFTTSVILITGIAVAAVVYSISNDFFLKSSVSNLQSKTDLIAHDIQNSLVHIRSNIQLLSSTPPIQGIVRSANNQGNDPLEKSNTSMWKARLSTIFRSMLAVNPSYTQIRYLGVADNGKELVRVNQNTQGIYNTHDSALQEKGSSDYFKLGTQLSPGSIYFSSINYNQEHGKIEYPAVVTLRTMLPVYSDKNKLFGMLVINVNVKQYLKNILLRSSEKYKMILLDEFNDVFLFNPTQQSLQFIARDKMKNANIVGLRHITKADEIVPYIESQKDNINIIKPIYADHNHDQKVFTLILTVPKSDLIKQDRGLIQLILFWVITICLVSSLLIYLFAKRTMLPLSKMAKSIAGSMGERLNEEQIILPVQYNDEVGLLARAYQKKTKLLSKLARFDSLTGLPNRKNFFDHAEESILRAKRSHLTIAVMYLDINDFKEMNDTYGHDYGDQLLIDFSYALQSVTRESDYVARLGGDEFAVLIDSVQAGSDIAEIVDRYCNALNTAYTIKGTTFNVAIAGGVAVYPQDAHNLQDLLHKADQAMYVSKKQKKPGFVFANNLKDQPDTPSSSK